MGRALTLGYHLVNVFTRDRAALSGNPLCVFEDAGALDEGRMQALARQFNLSETTFLLPPTTPAATHRVRIFTPDFEMPFAGHPTLGSAHVARRLAAAATGRAADAVTLEMKAGLIPVAARGDLWTLSANAPAWSELGTAVPVLAAALGLQPDELRLEPRGARPLWVDTGSNQLVVPLASVEALQRLQPGLEALEHFRSPAGRRFVYAFAEAGDGDVVARFLFEADGALREDPATGSACANLGGWYLATGMPLPLVRRVLQGDRIRRPSTLLLSVDAERQIRVGGEVAWLGRGEITLEA
ncbi:MAG: PhzF family phenazine biosynthesis protein [Gammaproteobacteria bacterium]|nr:PhzF family phenazine biosynthesis protein [Gammaproteobacteria bacterium]